MVKCSDPGVYWGRIYTSMGTEGTQAGRVPNHETHTDLRMMEWTIILIYKPSRTSVKRSESLRVETGRTSRWI